MAQKNTVEEALEELRFTLEQVKLCEAKPVRYAEEVRALIEEIDEDVQTVEDAIDDLENLPPDVKITLREAQRTKRSLNREAITLAQQERTVQKQPQSSPQLPKNKIKLNPIEVPIFDGDATKYRLFRSAFAENIEENTELTTTSRWIYLRRSLKGAPAEMLQQMPETEKNLADALRLLDATFGNPARVVQHLFHQIYQLPNAVSTNESLRLTQVKLESLLCSLENAGHPVDTDTHLQYIVISKFPPDITYQVAQGEILPLAQLREKFGKFISAREHVSTQFLQPTTSTPSTSTSTSTGTPRNNQRASRAPNQRPIQCLFCKGPHWSDECPTYTTVEARQQQIPDRCFKCLRLKHEGKCFSERRCVYCDDMSHNRALCPKKLAPQKLLCALPPPATPKEEGAFWTLCLQIGSNQMQQRTTIRAVIDSGGAKTIISSRLAHLLGLQADNQAPMQLQSLGATKLPPAARAHDSILIYPKNEASVSLPVYITTSIAEDLPAPSVAKFRQQNPQYDHLEIPETGAGQPVDLLFGKNALIHILTLANCITVNEQYQLLSTKFGHIIVSLEDEATQTGPQRLLTFATMNNQDVQRLFDFEEIGLKFVESKDIEHETAALKAFHDSIEFTNGRYYVGLPFLSTPPLLDENFGLAWGRLQSLWPKLRNKPQLLRAYHEIIQQQLLEHKIEVAARKSIRDDAVVHYIPHHPVVKPDNQSTKVRIVYDASAKGAKNKKSLNDNLHKGAPWVDDMVAVLQRFRRFPDALVADIKQAFLQIGIKETDRDAVRFIWLRNPFQPPTCENLIIYRFTRIAFGIISSPFLLHSTIAHHLRSTHNPLEKSILEDLYADNIVASLPPHLTPLQYYNHIKTAFAEMSMDMTKWASNNAHFITNVPPADRQEEVVQTVLGLHWNTQTDSLKLKPTTVSFTRLNLTKRKALQDLARIFDPLGWAAPLLLYGKLFLRKLWEQHRKWDEILPADLTHEWETITHLLAAYQHIELPRALLTPPHTSTPPLQLHLFVDASAKACAVVLYARLHTPNHTHTTLLVAKSKLTPKSNLSIPRLELLSLLLGTRLLQYITPKLAWPNTTTKHIWCDSRCALAWVQSGKILPAALQRQVDEINAAQSDSLRYLPSAWNPADAVTRGATYEDLRQQTWWDGPRWLLDDSLWPPTEHADESICDTQLFLFTEPVNENPVTHVSSNHGVCNLDITHFSTLKQLLKRTAFCIRGINVILKRTVVHTAAPLDYDRALHLWLLWMQQQAFPEMFACKATKPKQLRNIRVSIDTSGLIRCQSRLQLAALDQNTITPVLLAKKHPLTRLLILHEHSKNNHAGTAHTLAMLRQRYWLPQGRREIFNTLTNHCFQCRRADPKPFVAPPPSPLPEFRVTQLTRPFEAAGLDVFGPLATRTARPDKPAKNKRWVTIFTCTVTRAIHLEMLHDLNTSSIIEAFRRFAARRGTPRLIVCDNAPQFHVIQGKLLNLWQTFTKSADATSYFAQNTITFKFLPPHAPWMGGHYERLIGSIKQALKRTYGNTLLIDRQLETTLIEIESMLNHRPLTYVDQHIDSVIITPSHFLNLQFPALPLDLDKETNRSTILHLWKASQNYIQVFWKHWSEIFLLTLRDRDDKLKRKNKATYSIPELNDIVVVADPPEQRSSWKLARVERLIESADGQIRSAQLILGNRLRIVRPILHMAPLGLQADLPPPTQPLTATADGIVVDSTPYDPPNDPDSEEIIEVELELDWSSDEDTCTEKEQQGTTASTTQN